MEKPEQTYLVTNFFTKGHRLKFTVGFSLQQFEVFGQLQNYFYYFFLVSNPCGGSLEWITRGAKEVKWFIQNIVVGKFTFEFRTAFSMLTARWSWPPRVEVLYIPSWKHHGTCVNSDKTLSHCSILMAIITESPHDILSFLTWVNYFSFVPSETAIMAY